MAYKNFKFTEESKKKMSEIRKRLFNEGYVNPFKGRKHSEETKRKISQSKMGHKVWCPSCHLKKGIHKK